MEKGIIYIFSWDSIILVGDELIMDAPSTSISCRMPNHIEHNNLAKKEDQKRKKKKENKRNRHKDIGFK